jgi:hypothetical protein
MGNDRLNIQNRLVEIEASLEMIALREILSNPYGNPLEILKSMLGLVSEKLDLQKTLYKKSGGDLSNVVLLNERRVSA